MAFHLNSPWGLKADLIKFQLDRLMCDVERRIFAPRDRSDKTTADRSCMSAVPGTSTQAGNPSKKRCLSPELELKVESQKKRKKERKTRALRPSIPMPNVRWRCVAKAKPGDRRSIDCAMRWIPFDGNSGKKSSKFRNFELL